MGFEQNPKTTSRWAQMARSGKKVMQFIRDGRYVAVVADGKLTLYAKRTAYNESSSSVPTNHFLSMASIAASFRSTCGSERRAPECSAQRSPADTLHVGQVTDACCLGVSAFFFIRSVCENVGRKTVQFGTLSVLAVTCPEERNLSVWS
jgi:hypothetical protein